MRPESRLISYFADPYLSLPQQQEVRRFLRQPLSARLFLAQAKKEGVAALAYYHAKTLGLLSFFPGDVQEELRQVYYRYAARNAFLTDKTRLLLELSHRENLTFMILKGIALCHDVYPNMALRPVTDVDLLIREQDKERADRFLRQSGYRLVFETQERLFARHGALNSRIYTDTDESFSLHLHWHLVNVSWPADIMVEAIDMAAIWREAKPMLLDGVEALTLAPHHLLLYQVLHAFLHGMERLIGLSDIAAVAEKYGSSLDQDQLRRAAEAFRLSFVAAETFAMAQRLLRKDFSYFVGKDLKPSRTFFQKVLSFLIRKNVRSCLLSYLILLSLHRSAAQKLCFLWKTKQGRFLWRWRLYFY